MNETQNTLEKIEEVIKILEVSDSISFGDFKEISNKQSFPAFCLIEEFMNVTLRVLFPHICFRDNRGVTVQASAEHLYNALNGILYPLFPDRNTDNLIEKIISHYPYLREKLAEDINAIYLSDPAATSRAEVIVSYPGFLAIAYYRVAHLFYLEKTPYIPRMISELAHSKTGIDIHPGAEIGRAFAIDHGTGIVIGETSLIGDRVRMYQGVTVGAKDIRIDNKTKGKSAKKRHPTIGNDCILCAGALILGGETVVGDGCIIGAGVIVDKSVPAGKTVCRSQ